MCFSEGPGTHVATGLPECQADVSVQWQENKAILNARTLAETPQGLLYCCCLTVLAAEHAPRICVEESQKQLALRETEAGKPPRLSARPRRRVDLLGGTALGWVSQDQVRAPSTLWKASFVIPASGMFLSAMLSWLIWAGTMPAHSRCSYRSRGRSRASSREIHGFHTPPVENDCGALAPNRNPPTSTPARKKPARWLLEHRGLFWEQQGRRLPLTWGRRPMKPVPAAGRHAEPAGEAACPPRRQEAACTGWASARLPEKRLFRADKTRALRQRHEL